MWTTLIVTCLAMMTSQAMNLQGCYTSIEEDMGKSTQLESNTNYDCAQYCKGRGYVIAATHLKTCHCSVSYPRTMVGSVLHHNATGAGTFCSKRCPGAVTSTACEDDECCGGHYQGHHTYTVYSVGGIDVAEQVVRRIRKVLFSRHANMPWMREEDRHTLPGTKCTDEYRDYTPEHSFVRLDLVDGLYEKKSRVATSERCQKLCNEKTNCRGVAHHVVNRDCYLILTPMTTTETVPTEQTLQLYERVCKEPVDVEPQSFTFETEGFWLEPALERVDPDDVSPLLEHDFELDLTDSSTGDTVSRTVELTTTSESELTTETGVETTHANVHRMDKTTTTSTQSNNDVDEHSDVDNNLSDYGININVVDKTMKHRGFQDNNEVASAFLQMVGSSRMKSKMAATYNTSIFTQGRVESERTDNKQSYHFRMTVPPLHKGMMRFVERTTQTSIKWKTAVKLTGHIKIRVHNKEKHVHVSRLLASRDRRFYFLGSLDYRRRVVTGKTSITDRHGRPATDKPYEGPSLVAAGHC